MALKFIFGRSGSGKSTFALNKIAKKQAKNPENNLILIVPDQFSLQAEKDLIKETGLKGILHAKILSFHRLAYNVFKETGMPDKTPLSDITRAIALKKCILENSQNLTYYKSAVDKKGFVDQISLTMDELFSYCVTPEKLENIKEALPKDSALSNKLSDLLAIYLSYKDFLGTGHYIATEESLDTLYHRIDKSTFIKNAEIWLDGFYGYTPQELKIIEKLLTHAKDVTVLLTIDEYAINKENLPMSHVFYETKDTFLSLCALAKNYNIKIDTPVFLNENKRFKTSALIALENEYTKSVPKNHFNNNSICLYSANNEFDEIEYSSQKIISLVRDKGYRYRDIAILAASLSEYKTIINSTMKECKIPIFLDNKAEIENHPFIELVKGIFQVMLYNFNFDSVFSLLKTGLTSMKGNNVAMLENYCLAYGIKGYKWKLETWHFGMTKDDTNKNFLHINSLRKEFMLFFEPLSSIKLTKKYKVEYISSKLFEVLENMKIFEQLSILTSNLNQLDNFSKSLETEQCWNIFVEIIESLNNVLCDYEVTLKDYFALLESGLSVGKLGIIPPSIDNVIVGNLERTRLPKVKAVFLIGVNDGIIPSISSSEGMFSDEERELLESNQLSLAHNSTRLAFEENYLIYSAITKAEENLFITYSTGDLSGKTKLPSVIISKIRKIFPSMETQTEIEPNDIFSSPSIAFHHLGGNLKSPNITLPLWLTSLEFFENHPDWKNKTALLKKGLSIAPSEKFLSKNTTTSVFGDTLYSSVSRLEKFASCPYSYFLNYTVKAQERKIYELKTPDLGLLFHSVFEDFSNTLKKECLEWKDISYENTVKIVTMAVDRQVPGLSNEILLSSGSMQYLTKRFKRICIRGIWTLCTHLKNGNFVPFAHELGFGNNDVLPPIALELKDGNKMLLTGKIDRVDILTSEGNTFVKIIDYKSGSKGFSLKEIYYGLQLQLLIYLDALIKNGQNLFKNEPTPGGIFYFRIKDPMISAESSLTIDEIENLIAENLKMSGLVLNNPDVLSALDNTSDKKSKIAPLVYNADGSLSKSSSVANEETYDLLRQYSLETAITLGERIKSGDISIKPYKSGTKTPCDYCSYKSICNFEASDPCFSYNNLKSLSDSDVLSKIKSQD